MPGAGNTRQVHQPPSCANMGAGLQPRLWQLRHNTGNFTKIGPLREKLPAGTQQNQSVAGQFPAK
jgi:hypothetical protein